MSVNASVDGKVVLADSTAQGPPLEKLLSLAYSGSISSLAQGTQIPAAPTAIALPVSPTVFAYVKNLHATQTLQVTWTPNGGISAIVITLQPGDFILLAGSKTAGGITALTLQGSGANTTAEYLLLG